VKDCDALGCAVRVGLLLLAGLIFCVAGCARAHAEYEQAVREAVLSVVKCENPEILVPPEDDEEVDLLEYFSAFRKLPYSFAEVDLGEDIVGYRSDLECAGRAGNHTRLFELKDGRLEQVFELKGPYLFIDEEDVERVSGRYRLSHFVGFEPGYEEEQYYEYRDGKYVKLHLTEFVGEER
jgi:hypothetical protein